MKKSFSLCVYQFGLEKIIRIETWVLIRYIQTVRYVCTLIIKHFTLSFWTLMLVDLCLSFIYSVDTIQYSLPWFIISNLHILVSLLHWTQWLHMSQAGKGTCTMENISRSDQHFQWSWKNQGSKGFSETLQVVDLMISQHTHNMWETNCDVQTWCRSLT